jgi:hypothetical protein
LIKLLFGILETTEITELVQLLTLLLEWWKLFLL